MKAVAAEAQRTCRILAPADRTLIVAAAWLHDVGYAPTVTLTGVHALDGARFLRAQGWNDRLCSLVAHHSAAERASDGEFRVEQSAVSDLLWFVDMTIGHDGRRTTLEERLGGIATRYGRTGAVTSAMMKARPQLEAAIARTHGRLGDAGFQAALERIEVGRDPDDV